MDPTDQDQLKQALASQGVLVGQHDRALREVTERLLELSANVAQLGNQLSQLSVQLTAPQPQPQPQASAPPAQPPLNFSPREPHIPSPERYSGDLVNPVINTSWTLAPSSNPYQAVVTHCCGLCHWAASFCRYVAIYGFSGYQPPLFPAQEQEVAVPSVQVHMRRCRSIWRTARAALLRTVARNKQMADQHRRQAPTYQPGQRVWLSSRDLPLQVDSRKLAPKYIGPYVVDRIINPSVGQLKADPEKLKAVAEWPTPESRKQLQRFLGFANFYRRFIKDYSRKAAPLTRLTSTSIPFKWSTEAETAFTTLKRLFISAPVLSHPDPSRQFVVEVDASDSGIGAVLSQRSPEDNKMHPCAFFSRKLSPAERNYDIGNRELLAVVLALKEWRHWLEGAEHPFIVWTDHKNLSYLHSAKRLNSRQARWALFLGRFNFTLTYRPGSRNIKPDALSRQSAADDSQSKPELILSSSNLDENPNCLMGAVHWEIERIVREAQRTQPDPVNPVINHQLDSCTLFQPLPGRGHTLLWTLSLGCLLLQASRYSLRYSLRQRPPIHIPSLEGLLPVLGHICQFVFRYVAIYGFSWLPTATFSSSRAGSCRPISSGPYETLSFHLEDCSCCSSKNCGSQQIRWLTSTDAKHLHINLGRECGFHPVTFLFRPAHDISLEEFDDEDLSEITDDCGIGLNYDSDPYEKDSLILEKSDLHHPVCSFQDDFQEFEMIDDEDEEEEDDDDEDVDPDAPPSPSASPPPSPTLDSLNNNSSLSPKKGSWQDSLRNPTSQGKNPTFSVTQPSVSYHSCLEDGSQSQPMPASPVTQDQGPRTKVLPQTCRGGRNSIPPTGLLCDMEGNRRERPEYGSFGHHKSHTCTGEIKSDPSIQKSRVPSVDENSQCSDTEVDHDLNSDHNLKHSNNRRPTDTYTITSESAMEPETDPDPDGTSRCLSSTAPMGTTEGADTPLTDEELEKDFDEECNFMSKENRSSYVEFPPIEPPQPTSYPLTSHATQAPANDYTSPSSDPGIADMNQQGYVTSDRDRDLSSPGSDSDIEEEIEEAFACGGPVVSNMISSISETEIDLTSDESSSGRSSHLTNSIEEASSPTSDQELDPDTELEQDSGIVGLKETLLLGQPDPIKEGSMVPSPSPLPSPTIATPDSPLLPPESYDSLVRQNLDEEQSCEHQADPDETLPPPELCEDSLSRQMVLQIEPDHGLESFKRSFYLPVGPRLMPNSDDYDGTSEGESDSDSEDDLSENSDSPWLLSNLVNRLISEGSYPISCPEECLKRKPSVSDTISPSSDIGDGDLADEEVDGTEGDKEAGTKNVPNLYLTNLMEQQARVSEKNITDRLCKNSRQEEVEEPNNDLMMLQQRRDLDSPSLTESVISDKDEGRETDPQVTTRSSASLERITEVKNSLTLDLPTAQTNRCFSLTYSTDNDEEDEEDGDSYPYLTKAKGQTSYTQRGLELDSSPPIDCSVPEPVPTEHDLPLCEREQQQSEDDGLAYDSMKYTLVVDENTTLELVSLKRCTSVLSDDSELSTICDEEPLRPRDVVYGRDEEEVGRPELSSSEDSSPEADLPFSKKFLNVFVNSTTRSSSTESFGLFSCTINGEERDQTHRAVYRFIPRHADELELDVDDPLFVEEEEDDYWYRGYNMRTGERGIFPAFYATEVMGPSKELLGMKRNPAWMETFCVHNAKDCHVQETNSTCAPASLCELEISLQGVKLIMSLEDEYDTFNEFDRCSHFFQMKNISFCGCHPRNNW
ncbi:hypothetical protein WMY93_023423 [Mugilogobius chulae]|uniref:SH3 domain-containing protein n=1 Tax=Mugilogobius chulae TaxID=88201 RepID=A0AAW0NE61_9GOBI